MKLLTKILLGVSVITFLPIPTGILQLHSSNQIPAQALIPSKPSDVPEATAKIFYEQNMKGKTYQEETLGDREYHNLTKTKKNKVKELYIASLNSQSNTGQINTTTTQNAQPQQTTNNKPWGQGNAAHLLFPQPQQNSQSNTGQASTTTSTLPRVEKEQGDTTTTTTSHTTTTQQPQTSSNLRCSKAITSEAEAAECALALLKEKNNLWNFVSRKNHTGDVSVCTATTGTTSTSSYFTNNKSDFEKGLGTATIDECKSHWTDKDAYVCYINTGPRSCFLQDTKNGIESTRSIMKIGASVTNLVTFFPLQIRN